MLDGQQEDVCRARRLPPEEEDGEKEEGGDGAAKGGLERAVGQVQLKVLDRKSARHHADAGRRDQNGAWCVRVREK